MAASAHDDAGALEVTLGGGLHVLTPSGRLEGANLHSGRAEVAFARMAMEAGRRVSREALADAIWDDRWPASWESALRNVIVTLRRWVGTAGLDGPAILRTVTDGYRLDPPAGSACGRAGLGGAAWGDGSAPWEPVPAVLGFDPRAGSRADGGPLGGRAAAAEAVLRDRDH